MYNLEFRVPTRLLLYLANELIGSYICTRCLSFSLYTHTQTPTNKIQHKIPLQIQWFNILLMNFSMVFRNVVFFLIFLTLLLISSSFKMISSAAPPPPPPTREFKNKKTSSIFLTYNKHHKRRQVLFANKNKKRSETMKNNRNKDEVDRDDDRVFSVMFPKGIVPPSGSSSCHNDYPNSVASLCALSSRKPQNMENPWIIINRSWSFFLLLLLSSCVGNL